MSGPFCGQPMIQERRQFSDFSLRAGNPEPGFFAGLGIRMLTFFKLTKTINFMIVEDDINF